MFCYFFYIIDANIEQESQKLFLLLHRTLHDVCIICNKLHNKCTYIKWINKSFN
jgi:hypothetical protein